MNLRKQATQLPSKMRFVAAQYEALLADDLFIELGRRSNTAARRLHERLCDLVDLDLGSPPQANSLFPRLEPGAKSILQDWSFFWDWDLSDRRVRWMTAWDTSDDDEERFADGIRWVLQHGDN
jgi:threonine aldolase